MKFELDEEKNKINSEKHGIFFKDAIAVFSDPLRIEFYDAQHSIDEDRFLTIGLAHKILFVVYTERENGDIIRIISARIASPKERRVYHDSNSTF